ncbi:MAG TPA: nitroreductase/quinone reductase family protein [Candidatus Nitrosotenuis sp.]|jgi:deazaflavin-dependent oxidoreductase (nitroreductase family)|nr:nitroreductase/quinone reductase family protein [Candidatus Nitrosotenuis sp.]
MDYARLARLTHRAVERQPLVRLLTRLHVGVYRLTGGLVGGLALGVPTLLLTTRGRRTGRPYTTPLYYLVEGRSLAVVASAGGSDRDPGWWRNLQKDPRALVEMGPVRLQVRAERAPPEVAARLWTSFVWVYPAYDQYRQLTSREIPVVLLHPEAEGRLATRPPS